MDHGPSSFRDIFKGGDVTKNSLRLDTLPSHLRGLVLQYQHSLQNLQLTILECVDDKDYSEQIGKDFEELEKRVEEMIHKMV